MNSSVPVVENHLKLGIPLDRLKGRLRKRFGFREMIEDDVHAGRYIISPEQARDLLRLKGSYVKTRDLAVLQALELNLQAPRLKIVGYL